MRLLKALLSRIEMKEYYPSKRKATPSKPLKYLHISREYFTKVDPVTGVVDLHYRGITYRNRI